MLRLRVHTLTLSRSATTNFASLLVDAATIVNYSLSTHGVAPASASGKSHDRSKHCAPRVSLDEDHRFSGHPEAQFLGPPDLRLGEGETVHRYHAFMLSPL